MVKSVSRTRVTTFKGNLPSGREDGLAVEEPLEIRVGGRSLTVVMRTPGHDVELAAGLLMSEGIVSSAAQIGAIAHCRDPKDPQHENVLDVRLVPGVSVDWRRLKRSFFSNTSCGLCGKTTIESVKVSTPPLPDNDRPAGRLHVHAGGQRLPLLRRPGHRRQPRVVVARPRRHRRQQPPIRRLGRRPR